jgi:hypothetical protein
MINGSTHSKVQSKTAKEIDRTDVEACEVAGPGAAGYEGSAGGIGGKAAGKAGSEKGGSKERLLNPSVLADRQQTGHYGLMYVQPTTAFDQSLHKNASMEAIAAPQVCCRHCHASFPFAGATKGGTFTGAGQSYRRDLCHHIDYRP